MRISTSQMHLLAVNALLAQQAKLSKTQLEIASGKKFLTPSDDPAGAVAALGFSRVSGSLEQYQRNIERARSSLGLEDQTLSGVQDVLQRLRELAISSGSLSSQEQVAASYEVRQLENSLVYFANTKDEDGNYLFSGFQNLVQPYTNAGGGIFTFNGDQGQRLVEIAPATNIVATDSGAQIFNSIPVSAGGVSDMLSIVDSFAASLEAGTYTAPSTVVDIDAVLQRVTGTRATVGARINNLDSAKDLNESYWVDTQQNLSDVQDLDYAKAVSQLSLQLAGLEAAQQSFARIQNLSLFDYLR